MIKVNKKQESKLIETIAANEQTIEKQKASLLILQDAIAALLKLEQPQS